MGHAKFGVTQERYMGWVILKSTSSSTDASQAPSLIEKSSLSACLPGMVPLVRLHETILQRRGASVLAGNSHRQCLGCQPMFLHPENSNTASCIL